MNINKSIVGYGYFVMVFVAILAIIGCGESGPKSNYPIIKIESFSGDIYLELYTDKAPKTAGAFLQNVESGLYKRSSFYRVLSNENQRTGVPQSELIQGGIYTTNTSREHIPKLTHENTQQTGVLHVNGAISMARQDTGTASTEFFICFGDQHGFDYQGANNPDGQGYAAFGKVIQGMDIVRKIYRQPEDNQSFTPPIIIKDIRVVKP